ncbi:MAG: hypothetical protein JWM11_2528, partial [Planctomycetaceae bacterium]|nr:hypothetical protein [Planctomycetaceae bacterium]
MPTVTLDLPPEDVDSQVVDQVTKDSQELLDRLLGPQGKDPEVTAGKSLFDAETRKALENQCRDFIDVHGCEFAMIVTYRDGDLEVCGNS